MRVILIGADFEENLGMAMIAASLHKAGHTAEVIPFNEAGQTEEVARSAAKRKPDVIGLSMQFQHRGFEFLALARRLRALGFRGHITCGGQFPTLAWNEVLDSTPSLDSIVLHEGENTIVELLAALQSRAPLDQVPGLALRGSNGLPHRTAPRAIIANLDTLPLPRRYRKHSVHLGVPFIPISGSRGCWGSCSYCSITSFYRDARAYGGGRTLRLRSPKNLAAEMATLRQRAGGTAVFCFHDDNFLMPRPEDSLERVREIRAALDSYGPGNVGFIGKCRPECLTADLAKELRKLGVVRLYVGVENASQPGADHLNRRTQTGQVRAALAALREAGIFGCYNLLIFEPRATLADVRENVAFIREHCMHPVNFCRAEPYHGTPLHKSVQDAGTVGGSYLGWDYRISDDRAELLFRICASAFRERNFAPHGVANRYMGLGYNAKLIEHFYDDPTGRRAKLLKRVDEVTRGISSETADLLEKALRIAERADLAERDGIERETALLGLEVAALDRVWHVEIDELSKDMLAFSKEASDRRVPALIPTKKLRELMQGVAVAGLLSIGGAGCGGKATTEEPVPSDAGVNQDAADDATDGMVSDPVPWDGAYDGQVADPPPWDAPYLDDGQVADPPPWDAGIDGQPGDPPPWDGGMADQWADPAPWDGAMDDQWADPPPPDMGMDKALPSQQEHWRDTSPRRAVRSNDLPFYDPPSLRLAAEPEGNAIRVSIRGVRDPMSSRWESEGAIVGEGESVLWTPASPDDQLRVAVRTRGGVAVATLRAGR